MALYYNIVFGLLITEMVLFGLLSLPLPRNLRGTMLNLFSKPFQSTQFQVAIKCILVFILILFVDSVNRVFKVSAELQSAVPDAMVQGAVNGFADRSDVQARRFYAQRNMYLCGFTLFLTLILTRTYALVDELVAVKTELAGLEKTTVASAVAGDGVKEGLKAEIAVQEGEKAILKEKAEALSGDYAAAEGVARHRG